MRPSTPIHDASALSSDERRSALPDPPPIELVPVADDAPPDSNAEPSPDRPSGDDHPSVRWLYDVLDATGVGIGTAAAGALAVGVIVGAILWLLRAPSPPIDERLPLIEPSSLTTTTRAAPDVVVHVAGAVVRPGVVSLANGSRVVDALDAAGGPLPEADLGQLNLAAVVADGTRLYVPLPGETLPIDATGNGDTTDGGPVDLNRATAAMLEALPGIGPATAAAILDHRERHGPFTSVEGLLAVRGIGEAKLAQLRDLVRV